MSVYFIVLLGGGGGLFVFFFFFFFVFFFFCFFATGHKQLTTICLYCTQLNIIIVLRNPYGL